MIGTKQLGAAAPAYQPGASPGLLGGSPQQNQISGLPGVDLDLMRLLTGKLAELDSSQPVVIPDTGSSISNLPIGGPTQGMTTANPMGDAGPVSGLPGLDQNLMDKLQGMNDQKPSFLSGFANNLDNNLQSPTKVIGMGLLNRIDPKLGLAGLLAGGLFGGGK
jgi:hypothetical protein